MIRDFAPGIGQAVAERTIVRTIKKPCNRQQRLEFPRINNLSLDAEVKAYAKFNGIEVGSYKVVETDKDADTVTVLAEVTADIAKETWGDVAKRVSKGSSLLEPDVSKQEFEYNQLLRHMNQASVLLSGRSLQHGDETQPTKNIELFTNCSTAAMTFIKFYLLLNGSGVGRCYDDALMLVDWTKAPKIITAIRQDHADVLSGEIRARSVETVKHFYAGSKVSELRVGDSREGWAKALEVMETMTFQKRTDEVLILDFSDVRPRGEPIRGMQNRPASGPGPLMEAINKIAELRSSGMDAWRASMFADHYVAECVLVGGARRAARMAAKFWKDKTIFDFVNIKRGGFLWSSNNSVLVDKEFWDAVKKVEALVKDLPSQGLDISTFLHELKFHGEITETELHAKLVFDNIVEANYFDRTGEPGFINVDKLAWKVEGLGVFNSGEFAESKKFKVGEDAKDLGKALITVWQGLKYKVIVNPCGEIVLHLITGYCTVGDVVPYFAVRSHGREAWDRDAEDAFRVATRALIRINLMDALYGREVSRTNRIGVGFTGIHEYALARFGYGWRDLVNENKSKPFWLMMARFKRAVSDEAEKYSKQLGLVAPHTNTTVKPSGTTAKLFNLTEGAHLAAMREYIRWVQFRNDDPLIQEYKDKGYPVKQLRGYSGTTVVGFPTAPEITKIGHYDKLVIASEATPEEQYQWLKLLEKYWIDGVEEDGETPLGDNTGNQVSYTIKYDANKVSFAQFKEYLLNGQPDVKCCSFMPEVDTSAYEYLPEQAVTKEEFDFIAEAILAATKEDVGFEHVDCANGACPIDFNRG